MPVLSFPLDVPLCSSSGLVQSGSKIVPSTSVRLCVDGPLCATPIGSICSTLGTRYSDYGTDFDGSPPTLLVEAQFSTLPRHPEGALSSCEQSSL